MPRRKRHDEDHENHERWLVSYADFITLLFAFFVVMYSISSVSEGKYRVLSDSLINAFRNVSTNTKASNLAPPLNAADTPKSVMARKAAARAEELRREARERIERMAADLAKALGPLIKEGKVSVTDTGKGIAIDINASVLFGSGDAQLGSEAVTILRNVAEVLRPIDYPIVVAGYTDDLPIASPQFPSNWELSSMRAGSVVRLFIESGIEPRRLTATGYADQRPLAANDSPENRAKNRRVTLAIESPNLNFSMEPSGNPR